MPRRASPCATFGSCVILHPRSTAGTPAVGAKVKTTSHHHHVPRLRASDERPESISTGARNPAGACSAARMRVDPRRRSRPTVARSSSMISACSPRPSVRRSRAGMTSLRRPLRPRMGFGRRDASSTPGCPRTRLVERETRSSRFQDPRGTSVGEGRRDDIVERPSAGPRCREGRFPRVPHQSREYRAPPESCEPSPPGRPSSPKEASPVSRRTAPTPLKGPGRR